MNNIIDQLLNQTVQMNVITFVGVATLITVATILGLYLGFYIAARD